MLRFYVSLYQYQVVRNKEYNVKDCSYGFVDFQFSLLARRFSHEVFPPNDNKLYSHEDGTEKLIAKFSLRIVHRRVRLKIKLLWHEIVREYCSFVRTGKITTTQ